MGDFEYDTELPKEEQKPPFHDYYKKYLTAKDCLKDKDKLKKKIKANEFIFENELDLIET